MNLSIVIDKMSEKRVSYYKVTRPSGVYLEDLCIKFTKQSKMAGKKQQQHRNAKGQNSTLLKKTFTVLQNASDVTSKG